MKPEVKVSPGSEGSKAKYWMEEHNKYVAKTTHMPDMLPLVVERGEGVWIYDVDGNKYLDFTSGIAVCSLGWPTHPEIKKAIIEQLEKLAHAASCDFYHPYQVEFAKKLISVVPGNMPRKVFFSNSGTEANEAAIKLVRQATGRKFLLAFYGAFHGRTMGSLALTASKAIHHKGVFPWMPGVVHVPYPNPYRNIWHIDGYENPSELINRVLEFIEDYVFDKLILPDEVAAFVIEPIQGEGGYVVPPLGFFQELKKLLDKYGILIIDDEVQMGLGRTGKMFGIEHFNVVPEVLTIAKYIGGGAIPVGVTVFRADLDFKEYGMHANTFGANALGCIAGIKAIEIVKELLPHVVKLEKVFRDELLPLKDNVEKVGDVRGLGLAWGVEFVVDKKSKKPDIVTRDKVVRRAFEKGLVLLPCGKSAVRLIPPLVISEEEAKVGLGIFREAILESAT